MTTQLYQFAISHFSEKVRWALEFKDIPYEPVFLLPGTHARWIRALTGEKPTSVPVLVDGGEAIQGSARILDHLEQRRPESPLTPTDPTAGEAARRWEQRLDEEAGPAVRTFAYHHLLQRPKVTVPLLAARTPFYNRILLRLGFSRVDEIMRERLRINARTAETARQTIEAMLDEINQRYGESRFLAGADFSRADLTAAALFAPLFMPAAYPVPWPSRKRLPPGLREWTGANEARLAPLARIYQEYRQSGSTPG